MNATPNAQNSAGSVYCSDTHPETNVAPETQGLEDEFPFWEGLAGAMLVLGSVLFI